MLKPLEAGNSIKQLIIQNEEPETLRGIIKKVNRVTRHLHIQVGGYGLLRSVPVNRGINLGTPDRKVVFPGDTAVIVKGKRGWQCTSIEHKDRCGSKVSEFTGDIVVENEVEPVSGDSYVSQQVGALSLPTDLYLPPFQLLGNITLPDERFDDNLICGLPPCVNCAPAGIVTGYVLQISSDVTNPGGCYIWGPRSVVIGGTIWFTGFLVADPYYYRIDSLVATLVTAQFDQFRLGLPQDALITFDVSPKTIEYAGDGVNFASVETFTADERISPLLSNGGGNFVYMASDFSNRARQYFVSYFPGTETEFAVPKPEWQDAIYDSWTPATGDGKSITLFDDDTEFFVDEGEVYVYISMDGGAGWTKYSLGYLGQLFPSRLYGGQSLVTQDDWENPGVGDPGCCTYAGPGCVVIIPQQIPRKTYIYDTGNDVIYFAMCPPQLGSDPWLIGTDVGPVSTIPDFRAFTVTSKSDGTGAYVFGQVNVESALTSSGAAVSPYAPVGDALPFNNYTFGFVQSEYILAVWNIANDGSSSFQTVSLGIVGSGELNLLAAFSNIANSNLVYLFLFDNASTFLVYEYNWTADTLTDLVFTGGENIISTQKSDSGAGVSRAGSLFLPAFNGDFTQLLIWRYNGSWTSTDITTETSLNSVEVTISYVDSRVYLLATNGVLGVSDNDGDTWTWGTVADFPPVSHLWPDAY